MKNKFHQSIFSNDYTISANSLNSAVARCNHCNKFINHEKLFLDGIYKMRCPHCKIQFKIIYGNNLK